MALTAPRKDWSVELIRLDGTRRLFQVYDTEKEAMTMAAKLCLCGCPAETRDLRQSTQERAA